MKNVNFIYKQISNKKKAFTLIELLIVIAIIGILFIVLVSKVDFATDKAKTTGVQTDFRSFQLAFNQVAQENAGFNTFGYNAGDNAGAIPSGYAFETEALKDATIGDGIRNSYDQGDKNLNGKQDTGEVFTGRKIYTETWTEVYTLTKPGTTGLDADAVFALESAINKNLDPKLHITINATDGKITMANQARDPWKNEYHGVYISNAERDHGADRGAIIIYSNGANGKWGSAHDITNGVVTVTVPGNNVNGKDDMSITSCYSYLNGYGEVLNGTTGFSRNQSFLGTSDVNTVPDNIVDNDSGSDDGTQTIVPGFYNSVGELVLSYDDARSQYGLDVEKSYLSNYQDDPSNLAYILQNHPDVFSDAVKLIIPDDITLIGRHALRDTKQIVEIQIGNAVETIDNCAFMFNKTITKVTLGSSVKTIGTCAFEDCTALQTVEFNDGLEKIGTEAFVGCQALENVQLPNTLKTICSYAFSACYALTEIEIPDSVTTIEAAAFYSGQMTKAVVGSGVTVLSDDLFCGQDFVEIYLHKGIVKIESYALYLQTDHLTIYFDGTEAEWNAIEILSGNNAISKATIIYNYSY